MRRSLFLRYANVSAIDSAAFCGTMSNENFGRPSSCGVMVGRQLLKNLATVAIVFSIGVSSVPTTAPAKAFANSVRFLSANMSKYTPMYSVGSIRLTW